MIKLIFANILKIYDKINFREYLFILKISVTLKLKGNPLNCFSK